MLNCLAPFPYSVVSAVDSNRRPGTASFAPRGRAGFSPARWLWFLLAALALGGWVKSAWGVDMQIGGLSVQNQKFSFKFMTQAGTNYTVEYANSLSAAPWTSLASVTGTGDFVPFTDPTALLLQRYYRVRTSATSSNMVAASTLQGMAKAIYDQVQAGIPFDGGDIGLIFSLFGVAVISPTNEVAFQQKITANLPFLLDFQADTIARKLNEQYLITLDSFIASLATQGATAKAPAGPLTRSYLTANLAPLMTQTNYSPAEVLPALVLALSRERNAHYPVANPDPVWGDGLLDSVQFHLLFTSITYSANPSPTLMNASPDTVSLPPKTRQTGARLQGAFSRDWTPTLAGQGRNFITGQIGNLIQFPLGAGPSAQAVLCSSILIYSYEFTIQATPVSIAQRTEDRSVPYQSTIKAILKFNFPQDVNSFPKQVALFAAGCNLPANGTQAGKEVDWTLTDELPGHGSLTDHDVVTWPDGHVQAVYTAMDEAVPKALRANQIKKDATGLVEVRARNLVPGNWSKLEVVARAAAANPGGQGETRLFVSYYKMPQMSLKMRSDIHSVDSDSGTQWDGLIMATLPLQLKSEVNAQTGGTNQFLSGDIAQTYASFTMSSPGVATTVNSLAGDTLRVKIPVPAGTSTSELTVLLSPGNPAESLTFISQGQSVPLPAGRFWFTTWYLLHTDELDQDTSVLAGQHWKMVNWQPGSGTTLLSKKYSRSTIDPNLPTVLINESTTLDLISN